VQVEADRIGIGGTYAAGKVAVSIPVAQRRTGHDIWRSTIAARAITQTYADNITWVITGDSDGCLPGPITVAGRNLVPPGTDLWYAGGCRRGGACRCDGAGVGERGRVGERRGIGDRRRVGERRGIGD